MTAPKRVANTLINILQNPFMVKILDKSRLIENSLIDQVLNFWSYDLYSRKPGIAYKINDEGDEVKYTTLDVSTFLFALRERQAIVSLPEYDPRRPKDSRSNETRLDENSRFGQILNLTSNKEVFTFGFRIKDNAVVVTSGQEQKIGAYRTYLVTDMDGQLYDGWKQFDFVPTIKENEWFTNKNLWDGDCVRFERFVSPEKWQSFYGQYYFITKALINRLIEERNHLNHVRDKMIEAGIRFPSRAIQYDSFEDDTIISRESESGESQAFSCFEAEVDYPSSDTSFPVPEFNSDNLKIVSDRKEKIFKDLERLRFLTRSIELAFSQMNPVSNVENNTIVYPSWVQNNDWQTNFSFPRQRKKWYRLKIMQPSVGDYSVALRFRYINRTQSVR